ncbi:MAG: hypothetical protein MMC33_010619 [Icmadophila ericetorum]|nr:hypothetical protein [Icmadophila ericetorum]
MAKHRANKQNRGQGRKQGMSIKGAAQTGIVPSPSTDRRTSYEMSSILNSSLQALRYNLGPLASQSRLHEMPDAGVDLTDEVIEDLTETEAEFEARVANETPEERIRRLSMEKVIQQIYDEQFQEVFGNWEQDIAKQDTEIIEPALEAYYERLYDDLKKPVTDTPVVNSLSKSESSFTSVEGSRPRKEPKPERVAKPDHAAASKSKTPQNADQRIPVSEPSVSRPSQRSKSICTSPKLTKEAKEFLVPPPTAPASMLSQKSIRPRSAREVPKTHTPLPGSSLQRSRKSIPPSILSDSLKKPKAPSTSDHSALKVVQEAQISRASAAKSSSCKPQITKRLPDRPLSDTRRTSVGSLETRSSRNRAVPYYPEDRVNPRTPHPAPHHPNERYGYDPWQQAACHNVGGLPIDPRLPPQSSSDVPRYSATDLPDPFAVFDDCLEPNRFSLTHRIHSAYSQQSPTLAEAGIQSQDDEAKAALKR